MEDHNGEPVSSFTYRHAGGCKKWNDHFIISNDMKDSISRIRIVDDGENLSDHLPVILEMTTSIQVTPRPTAEPPKTSTLKWEKRSVLQRQGFTDRVSEFLQQLPVKKVCSLQHCDNISCTELIQEEYDGLIQCLLKADKKLPRKKPGAEKSWWTTELSRLQQQSIDVHELWKGQGKPRSGPIFLKRQKVRAAYRRGIKSAQTVPKQQNWDALHEAMTENDSTSFWRSWRKLHNKNGCDTPAPVVNGLSSHSDIAETFKQSFQNNCKPNNNETVRKLNNEFNRHYAKFDSTHQHKCNCMAYSLNLNVVLDAVFSMKIGKCSDDNGVNAEHFLNAPLQFYERLVSLGNSMLCHSFVPQQFRFGFIIPLVKDNQGNKTSTDNYRGITISAIFSQIF